MTCYPSLTMAWLDQATQRASVREPNKLFQAIALRTRVIRRADARRLGGRGPAMVKVVMPFNLKLP
jgi:hypothetical protein